MLFGVAEFIYTVSHGTSETETGQPGQTPCPAEETEALLGLRSR